MRHDEVVKLAFSRFMSLADFNRPEFHENDIEKGYQAFMTEFSNLFDPGAVENIINDEIGPSMLRLMVYVTGVDMDEFVARNPEMQSFWVHVASQVGLVCFYTGIFSQKILDEETADILAKFNKLIGDNNARDEKED